MKTALTAEDAFNWHCGLYDGVVRRRTETGTAQKTVQWGPKNHPVNGIISLFYNILKTTAQKTVQFAQFSVQSGAGRRAMPSDFSTSNRSVRGRQEGPHGKFLPT